MDIDGDGDFDAFSGESYGTFKYYQNTGTSSAPTFVEQTGGSNPLNGEDVGDYSASTFVDIDGDGDFDAFSGEGYYYGTFKYYRNHAPVGTVSPVVADLNAATNANVSVIFNSTASVANANTFVVHGAQTGERAGAYSGNNTTTLTFDPTNNFEPGEEIQATLTSGIVFSSGGTAMEPPRVWTFTAAAGGSGAVFSGGETAFFGTGSDATASSVVADVDADGDLDIAVGNRAAQNVVYLNDGNNGFASANNFGTGSDNTTLLIFGDVDGDGFVDIAASNSTAEQNKVYLGDGDGTFDTTSKNFGTGTDNSQSVVLGDIDGDGDLDLAIGQQVSQNRAELNDGSGNFSTAALDFGIIFDNTVMVLLADVDDDGDLDVAAGNVGGTQSAVYLNDGSGDFIDGTQNFGVVGDETRDLALGDVDGDGDVDVAVGNITSQQNEVHLNDDAGNFTAGTRNFGTGSDVSRGVALGDLFGGGYLDAVVANDGGQNRVDINDGAGNFSAGNNFGNGTDATQKVVLGDMDGDGRYSDEQLE